MEQKRDAEDQSQKDDLADDERDQIPTLGARVAMIADAPSDQIPEVVEQMPLDHEQAIERPDVKMLPAVKPIALLVRREACEHAQIDVGVLMGDVDVGVVIDAVLVVPEVG